MQKEELSRTQKAMGDFRFHLRHTGKIVSSQRGISNQGRIQGGGGGGGGGGVWGLQPPLLSKFLFFPRSFRGFWGLQPPLLSNNLVFRTYAGSNPPP